MCYFKVMKTSEELSTWYLKLLQDAELADYGPVKGTIVIRPWAYAIWEKIQVSLDARLKAHGAENAYFPLFIPESYLKREKEHVAGFSPELAVVTHAGGEKLEEPAVVRPTSETLMYALFAKWLSSYKQLPMRLNQWCNVVRWEKRTLPFIRTSEFLWQETHTVHATAAEAEAETLEAMGIYEKFFNEVLAIPVIAGRKSESEKFAGAVETLTVEGLMPDGKALQLGTSHFLGQNFSKPFGVKFQDKEGKEQHAYQCSYGMSTRVLGGLIMVHGDEKGMILPPNLAPVQIIIIPIYKSSEEKSAVLDRVLEIETMLTKETDLRVKVDRDEEKTPGFKYNQWEMRGVPVRLEVGPKEVAGQSVVLAMRDTGAKKTVKIVEIVKVVTEELDKMRHRLFEKAQTFLTENTREVESYEEFKDIMESKRGLVHAFWCGSSECENRVKEETKATIRTIPLEPTEVGKCVVCGKESSDKVFWARAY